LNLSAKFGGVINEQAQALKKAVDESRKLYAHAAATKPKPSAAKFQELLTPIATLMGQIGEIKEKNRDKNVADHLAAVSEGVQVLGWVTVEPAPAPYAKESAAAAKFYTNKILKQYRGKDEDHVSWVTALTGFFDGFEGYVKQHHTTGLTWGSAAGAPRPVTVAAASTGGAESDFAALISEHLDDFLANAKKIAGPVQEQAEVFLKAVTAEKELIGKAKTQKKPNDEGLQKLLGPVSELMGKVGEFKDKNNRSPYINHLTAVAEAVQILGWVAVEPAPGPYAKEMLGAAEFYTNKVLKEYKGKDETHVAYVNGLVGFLKALHPYILAHHTTGLTWGK
jgi:hypothetical protein